MGAVKGTRDGARPLIVFKSILGPTSIVSFSLHVLSHELPFVRSTSAACSIHSMTVSTVRPGRPLGVGSRLLLFFLPLDIQINYLLITP